jgi:hypothetical protein
MNIENKSRNNGNESMGTLSTINENEFNESNDNGSTINENEFNENAAAPNVAGANPSANLLAKSPRFAHSLTPVRRENDWMRQHLSFLNGTPLPQAVPVDIERTEVPEEEVEEGDTFDENLFTQEEIDDAADLPSEDEIATIVEEREEFQALEDENYETIEESANILQPVQEKRAKRTTTPSSKIQNLLDEIEEKREMKRILEERKKQTEEARAERRRREEEKQQRLAEKCQVLPRGTSIRVSHAENIYASIKSNATELGETRQECINTQTLLSRKQYTESGSDFSMMRYLHCPTTPCNVDSIGDRDDCLCWLCGYPMMTKQPYSEGKMIKPLHGQVSPEHTFPVMAGNSLIGLPTKEFIKRHGNDKRYLTYAINFLKKGLTYSHFWCNEVKNALRLVTWPRGELPKPNERNIDWLLAAMWYGIKRERGNRWFDQPLCFVILTHGGQSYKFYNIIHYFTLRDQVMAHGFPSPEIISTKGREWIARRKVAITGFVQDICNDIHKYTQLHHGGMDTPINVLSETLKEIYKDKVINGSKSTIVWPPTIMAVKALSQRTRKKRAINKATQGKKKSGHRPKHPLVKSRSRAKGTMRRTRKAR